MKTTEFTAEEERLIENEYQALLNDYLNSMHSQRVELIDRAYHLAKQAHNGVRRLSGEPYMMHPLSVARIVVREIGLGSTSICAALLHDVVEDTDYTTEDIERIEKPRPIGVAVVVGRRVETDPSATILHILFKS